MGEPCWTVVVPVKRLSAAKSRLRGTVPVVPHEAFALALAQDTIRAVLDCPVVARVTLVTDDPVVVRTVRGTGARVVADPGGGLNAAYVAGARRRGEGWVAAITADLPALHPWELAEALRAAAGADRCFVADTPGTGTVLLTAAPGVALEPRFGNGSAAAHAASGAVALTGGWPTLRRDVDTPADLAEATVLGLGPHSRSLLGPHRRSLVGRQGPAAVYGAGMQGTVATYDQQTHAGTLLLDDGTELAFPAAAFDASGLRLLRLGQRVTVQRDTSGRVVRVGIPGVS